MKTKSALVNIIQQLDNQTTSLDGIKTEERFNFISKEQMAKST